MALQLLKQIAEKTHPEAGGTGRAICIFFLAVGRSCTINMGPASVAGKLGNKQSRRDGRTRTGTGHVVYIRQLAFEQFFVIIGQGHPPAAFVRFLTGLYDSFSQLIVIAKESGNFFTQGGDAGTGQGRNVDDSVRHP